jgi:hypothetical protein
VTETQSQATNTSAAQAAEVTVSVSRLSASARERGGETTITIQVSLRTSDRSAAANYAVTVEVRAPDGSVTLLTGSTDRSGKATLAATADAGPGTYRVTIVDVSGSADYRPAGNAKSSTTVRVR